MKEITNTSHQIEWIYTIDFPGRATPIVILADGNPGFGINQWIYWLLEEGTPPSTLEEHIRHVMQLYEFHYRTYRNTPPTRKQAKHLVADFLDTKRRGSEILGWKPISRQTTLKKCLNSINKFDEWQSNFHGAKRLNPSEQLFMSNWEIYRDFRQREKWDPMIHLFPSRSHRKTVHKHAVRVDHKRFQVGQKTIPKAFPIERFVELVESTPSPRDQMLWLLMGGGSLRQSETLHFFYQDIRGIAHDGTAKVRLDDPEVGEITWVQEGNLRTGTRAEYLATCFKNEKFRKTRPELYRLVPRTQGKRGVDHVGFKGMTFSTTPDAEVDVGGRIIYPHEIFWCDPRFGTRFQRAYEQYVEEHFYGKPSDWPHHPWLFITTAGPEYGLPMKLGSLRRAWHRALKRIGMADCGLGGQSLRHMYGGFCASVLKLPIEQTKMLMHHANISSTQVYYHLRSDDVRNAIVSAIAQSEEKALDYLIVPETPQPTLPDTWGE